MIKIKEQYTQGRVKRDTSKISIWEGDKKLFLLWFGILILLGIEILLLLCRTEPEPIVQTYEIQTLEEALEVKQDALDIATENLANLQELTDDTEYAESLVNLITVERDKINNELDQMYRKITGGYTLAEVEGILYQVEVIMENEDSDAYKDYYDYFTALKVSIDSEREKNELEKK